MLSVNFVTSEHMPISRILDTWEYFCLLHCACFYFRSYITSLVFPETTNIADSKLWKCVGQTFFIHNVRNEYLNIAKSRSLMPWYYQNSTCYYLRYEVIEQKCLTVSLTVYFSQTWPSVIARYFWQTMSVADVIIWHICANVLTFRSYIWPTWYSFILKRNNRPVFSVTIISRNLFDFRKCIL